MIPIGPRETSRMQFRIALFKRRGMRDNEADALADRLLARDCDRDDRRSCMECSNYQRGGTCFAQQNGWIKHSPQRDCLWRCECFEFCKP